MASKRGKVFWEKLVREVEAGASQVEVARHHGVSQSWLGSWCRRLRHQAPKPALLPIRLIEERPRRLELVVDRIRLSFEVGTDPAYVAALAAQLSS